MGVSVESPTVCPRCGRATETDARACTLCGEVVRREAAPPRRTEAVAAPALAWQGRVIEAPGAPPRICGLPPRAFVLLAGLVLAPVLTWTPLLRYMGWFLASLVHETGHSLAAWITGCPAFPAIRLDGHAAAVHRDPVALLQVVWAIALVAACWACRASPRRARIVGGVASLWALVTFAEAPREAFFLWAGHLGELAFAGYALVQATRGGFSGSLAERCTHAAAGAYLVGRNVVLGFGLLTSASARSAYAGNGSFGLENDLVRVARDVHHLAVPAVGGILLFLSVLVAAGGVAFAVLAPEDD
jgi:hypothetical protein